MTLPASKKSAPLGKIILIVLVLVAAAAGGMGYFSQKSNLDEAQTQTAALSQQTVEKVPAPLDPSDALFTAQPGELVFGKPDAAGTIIEYSSMSCPHCAFFHSDMLPQLKKDLLDTGKAKLVFRYFPLNEPALRATQLVECAPAEKRAQFIKVLFELQKNWAFSERFKDELKTIAAQGGLDAAQVDSCFADKQLEDRIIEGRQVAATRAGVNSTPSFFVNGVKLEDFSKADHFAKALESAPKKPAQPTGDAE